MLTEKHLKPWLLIHLIMSVLLSLTIMGILAVILINGIHGLSFSSASLSTCLNSTFWKLTIYMGLMLKVSFFMTILAVVFAFGQIGCLLWSFIMFRRWLKDKTSGVGDVTFTDLSLRKLVAVYMLNLLGVLALVSVTGSYIMFYIEFNQCSDAQNLSSLFTIPAIIALAALVLQLLCFILLLKLFYHYNGQLEKTYESQQSDQQKTIHRNQEKQQLKKGIMQSNNSKDVQMFRSPQKLLYNSNSTDLQTNQSPQGVQLNLLNRYSKYKDDKNSPNTIYESNSNNKNGVSNIRNLHENNGNAPGSISHGNLSNHPNGANAKNQSLLKMSPNSIANQQKQIMKKIPKYPYKKNGKQKLNHSDVIFEQLDSKQDGSQLTYNPQQDSLQDDTSAPQQKIRNKDNIQARTSGSSLRNIDFSKSKYLKSPYLMNLQNKNITPQQRRNIKRPFLRISSNILQFDSSNYQDDDFSFSEQKTPVSLIRQKSNLKGQSERMRQDSVSLQRRNNYSNGPHEQSLVGIENRISQGSSLLESAPRRNLQTSRLLSNLFIGPIRDQQNPLNSYIQEDQVYQDQINKINQFNRINRKKRNIYNNHGQKYKQSQGKLYLHKNRMDLQYNGKNTISEDQDNEFNPFDQESYHEQMIHTQRQLTNQNSQTPKNSSSIVNTSSKLNISKNQPNKSPRQFQDSTSVQVKKTYRKDGTLLDLIRSKHVID